MACQQVRQVKQKHAYSSQGLKPEVVSLYGLNMVVPRKPPVTVHHECDMLGNWALLEGADEQFSQLPHSPCDWRRGGEPLVYARVVQGAHGGNC
jgi:hypothetical protein